ncbi:MAG: chloride channel protein [Bacteroidota bacterium]
MSVILKLKELLFFFLKWIFLLASISLISGSLSAVFLVSLNYVTSYRNYHREIIYLLPIAGLCIGLCYHYYGKSVARGNDLIFDTIYFPKDVIPFKMLPFVLFGTLVTHLFGGSAGREGTALQMSAAAADQFHNIITISTKDRVVLLIAALSAGFASVFGTPLAGAIFGLEVLLISKIPFKAIAPALITAYLANFVAELWGIKHIHYQIPEVPDVSVQLLGYTIISGLVFGIAAVLFVRLTSQVSSVTRLIRFPPLRPFTGGIIVVALLLAFGAEKFAGLGIPTILRAFEQPSLPADFLLKILITAITLGMGFKGGEVTPLFFIGATLGSALSLVFPIPVSLMAGMGFVAVFSGAAKTPVACIVMSVELFGISGCIYMMVACVIAYLISGRYSIYNAGENKQPRHFLFRSHFNF